jgi:hypothetical protein
MSTTTACLVGDAVRVDFSFTLLGTETVADPDVVKVIHRDPFLAEVVYEYLVDPEVTKLGVGQYRFEIVIGNQPRTHWFRTWGSEEVDKAQEVSVEVAESYFADPLDSIS